MLEGRNAIVYGGGGQVGRAIATAYGGEGAIVHLVGRTRGPLEETAEAVRAAGGDAEVAELDAREEREVDEHVDAVVAAAGRIDVTVNATSAEEAFGTSLTEISLVDFERPVHNAVRANFLTARAAARHMTRQRAGVILMFGGYGDPLAEPYLGGFQVGLTAVDALRRQLAAELGRYGVRVLTLQSSGVVEANPAAGEEPDDWTAAVTAETLLGRAATLEDVGRVAVFAASDWAAAMTATKLNITAGAEVD